MKDQLKGFKLATREADRMEIEGRRDHRRHPDQARRFRSAKKYPLLVVIHGGPTGVDRPSITGDRTYPMEMFAAKGAVILRPNYRGSAGYGEKFRSLNVRNLGLGDADDVLRESMPWSPKATSIAIAWAPWDGARAATFPRF